MSGDEKHILRNRSLLERIARAYPVGVPVKLWDRSEILLGPAR